MKLFRVRLGNRLGNRYKQTKDVKSLKITSTEPFGHGALGRVGSLLGSASRAKINENGPLWHFV